MARTQREWARPPQVAAPDYVSNLIYTDPAIFDDEREHIARKTWKFACHESEIPAPGDYRTFDHAGCPLIAARGDDGVVRSFVNACSHRAARILREPRGNARNWTCLFHHWTYDNRGACIAIPREEGFAASGVAKEDAGLREVRTAVRLGMVFVNLDDDAPSFDAYVGDALENLADVMGGPEELEVFHIYRHLTHTNWKQLQEVQMELYHEYLHFVNRQVAMVRVGLSRPQVAHLPQRPRHPRSHAPALREREGLEGAGGEDPAGARPGRVPHRRPVPRHLRRRPHHGDADRHHGAARSHAHAAREPRPGDQGRAGGRTASCASGITTSTGGRSAATTPRTCSRRKR